MFWALIRQIALGRGFMKVTEVNYCAHLTSITNIKVSPVVHIDTLGQGSQTQLMCGSHFNKKGLADGIKRKNVTIGG